MRNHPSIRLRPGRGVASRWLFLLALSGCEPSLEDRLPDEPELQTHVVDLTQIHFVSRLGSPGGGGDLKERHHFFARMDVPDIHVTAPSDGYVVEARYLTAPAHMSTYFGVGIRVSDTVTVMLDHLHLPSEAIAGILPPLGEGFSAFQRVDPPLFVRAGERIGSIMPPAPEHAYGADVVTRDTRRRNRFANQARFEGDRMHAARLHAICFEEALPEHLRREMAGRYGDAMPIPTADCGTMERDVPGALTGLWFLDAEPDTTYGERFAIASELSGLVRLNVSLQLPAEAWFLEDRTDPATITAGMSHCYVEPAGGRPEARFAYFRMGASGWDVDVAFGAGECPASFPATFRTYHR
ncbi:MAG: hypothetical protein KF729_10215 [Sandaracinaceae bacterium]|nr:hypothetical protein [Sandaracinaceae bacterium]